MKFFTKEVKIAVVTIIGIVLLFFGMNFLKGKTLFGSNMSYYIRFDNINGLSSSSPVYAQGYKVGVVKGITYDYTRNQGAIVELDLDKNLRLPLGTTAEIESDLMGNVKMNLVINTQSHDFYQPGDTLAGAVDTGMMGTVSQLVPVVQQMLSKLDSILTNVNLLLSDPAIAQSLHNVRTISANLTTTTAGLNTLVAGLNSRMPGMMGKADDALAKANTTLDNTSRLTSKLADVDIASTMSKVDQTLANVQNITTKLNSNQGSLGLLMNDDRLYHNLNATMGSADSLLTDLKAHPKRYVHFSIFGKKDK
jgi:phospholipid/cholesterol/gamma-HCH transport system substrate-binding protein